MKKSILILTDLSENALRAAETAMYLAGKLRKNLILLNCNNTISAITYYPIVPVSGIYPTWYEDRKAGLQFLSNHLKQQFTTVFPDQRRPVISTLIREGDLQANVKEVLKHHSIEMIVMGERAGSATEHLLFGSDTKNVIDQSPLPVLIVSASKPVRPVVHLTFATDFLEQDTSALNFLTGLRHQLQARLEIVHFKLYGKAPRPKSFLLKKQIEQACQVNPPLIIYKEVFGKNLVSRLETYCKETNPDILALSHQHHSILFRMLKEGTVGLSLSRQHTSLLIIPDLNPERDTHNELFEGLSNVIF